MWRNHTHICINSERSGIVVFNNPLLRFRPAIGLLRGFEFFFVTRKLIFHVQENFPLLEGAQGFC